MNKGLLIARHEYVEMVRTKTFWLGLLAFPVILVLAMAVPLLLEGAREPRTYAVVDDSGFLQIEVARLVYERDLRELASTGRQMRKRGGRQFEQLPPILRRLTAAWMELDETGRGQFVAQLAGNGRYSTEHSSTSFSDRAAQFLDASKHELRQWWDSVGVEELERMGFELSRSDYLPIDLPSGDGKAEVISKLNGMLNRDELFAYFVIGPDPVAGSEGCKYVSNNLTDHDLPGWFEDLASEVIRKKRIRREEIDPQVANWIEKRLEFEGRKVASTGVEEEVGMEDKARQWAPVVFTYLLWFSIFTSAQMLLTSTIEEKSARIIEVLLSSVSPLQLMIGKLVGVAGAGLTVVASWAVWLVAGVLVLPAMAGARVFELVGSIVGDPFLLLAFVAYFVLGYLLYAAFLVGVGSVCNNLKDAQNLMMPVMIPMIVAISSMIPIGKDPNGLFAQIMSFIPPFTPFVMMNRSAGPPAIWEYGVTTVVLLGAIYLAVTGAAKIFRIGILMTGKPPRIREVLKWLTMSEAATPAGSHAVTDE